MTPAEELEYAALFADAQRGDVDAYRRCLHALTRELRAYVRGRTGDVPWVEDVVQDTLMSLHAARHTYDPARPFGAWFYAIARNRVIDGMRRAQRRARLEVPTDVLPEAAAVPAPERDEQLRAALSHLPPRQRHVIERMKLHGDSVREVAGDLGMSESAVKVAAHRGYKALRRLLTGRDER